MSESPAGWHPDPRGRHEHRYWDGSQWTDHVADGGVLATDPVSQVTPVAAPVGPSMVNLPAIGAEQAQPASATPAAETTPAATPEGGTTPGGGPLWAADPQPEPEPEP